jgi:TetR/AcrR family transcriptional repressor of mexJK operon
MMRTKKQSVPGECERGGKSESILTAARDIFLESGYAAASMDAVAAAANVSKATIYAHFANKRALFEAVLTRRCTATFGAFTVPECCADARQVLHSLARLFLDLILAPEALAIHRVVLSETPRLPEVGEAFFQVGPIATHRMVCSLFADLTHRGLLAIPEAETSLAVYLFFGMLKGDMHLRAVLGVPPSEVSREELVNGAVEMLMARYGR